MHSFLHRQSFKGRNREKTVCANELCSVVASRSETRRRSPKFNAERRRLRYGFYEMDTKAALLGRIPMAARIALSLRIRYMNALLQEGGRDAGRRRVSASSSPRSSQSVSRSIFNLWCVCMCRRGTA